MSADAVFIMVTVAPNNNVCRFANFETIIGIQLFVDCNFNSGGYSDKVKSLCLGVRDGVAVIRRTLIFFDALNLIIFLSISLSHN